jgi:hypothetical protein
MCVWFPPQHVITRENPEALLARFGIIGLAFARFIRPDMKRVWVNVTAITEVRAPAPGLFAPGVNAVLFMGFNSIVRAFEKMCRRQTLA